ncbi:ABC transporter ATP-binding protein [Synechococcus sp. LTW-R]|nr:ABC transporter ATP-binding protein [Synechococcus sp. LTW-R]
MVLSLVTLASAVAELVSLGSALPFLAVLTEPEQLWKAPWIQQWAPKLGWSSPSELLGPAAGVFAFAAVTAALVRLANLWLSGQLAAAIGSDLSCEAYRKTLYQPYSVHVRRNSSAVINSVTGQIGTTVSAINLVLQTSTSTLVAISLLLGLFCIDWAVALSAAGLFGGSYVLIGFFSRRALLANGRIINDSRKDVVKSLQEGIGAIRDVILDGTQNLYLDIYRRSDRPQRQFQARNQFLSLFPRFSLEALGLIAISVLATALAAQKGGGAAAMPVLGAFALGAQRLLPAMQQTYSGWSNLKGFSADLGGVLEMLQQPLPDVLEVNKKLVLKSEVRFCEVCFSYGQGHAGVLNDLSLKIERGQRVGFIGSTGSGKSTTVDVLMGLLSPTKGQILVDELNLHDHAYPERLLAWRSAIAHVPQSIYLADSSIAGNIAFGVPTDQIDFDRVRLAAQQAQIASFIEASPDGYDSFVGERGIRLSGGQRQRLGIARALYKQAQVLILDEATSALDNDTEQAVMDAINQLDRNLTVVMIAHRLSTVAKCDRVIRLDHGRVVADGPPSEVLAQA